MALGRRALVPAGRQRREPRLREVLEGPKKEEIVIQVDASGEPPDIDRRGLEAELDDGRMAVGPPLDDLKNKAQATRRSRRVSRRSARRP